MVQGMVVKVFGFRGSTVQGLVCKVSSVEFRVQGSGRGVYRGTSLIRNSAPLGPYSRNMPRALWWS